MQIETVMQSLREIYDMFEDDLSKEIYLNRLSWLVTGDFKYVDNIVKRSHPNMPVWNRGNAETLFSELPVDKKIIFYGAGDFVKRLLPYIKKLKNVVFCDGDIEKQKIGYHGYPVIGPEELFSVQEEKSIVICTTKYAEEVKRNLVSNGILESDLIDVREYLRCETGDAYFYENFLHYSEKEIFIDAGCYDLGTTSDFAKFCKGLKKVYAFEPDIANFERCLKRIEKGHLPEIVLLPYGTWSSNTELYFNAIGSACSNICGEGDTSIKTAAIDDIVADGDKVTFIKMDVEGAEMESLKGAQKIIKRDKPKLAICIYHKPEDMITIPLYVRSLVSEYKFYLRSYSNGENEVVLYAVDDEDNKR